MRSCEISRSWRNRRSASPRNLKAAHPEVEWSKIAGLRNILVHDYLGINLVRIWEILQHGLPELKNQVDQYSQGARRTIAGTGKASVDSGTGPWRGLLADDMTIADSLAR